MNEIRDCFIDYFAKKQHTVVDSSSTVPANDPTLLFTNAGMVQFKDYFLHPEKSAYKRAVSSQKCLRVGGKHNDLENVGYTARHHTFFEMLGNFSFGDYFKAEAIDFAWEFSIDILGLDENKIYATVHDSDDEAEKLWLERTRLPKDRIIRLGDKDNFWSMGDTGPCGPCSELLYDQGENTGCGSKSCRPGSCDCDRYLEYWNLVFMQYYQNTDGSRTNLPSPCIDTGMGLERIAAIVQGELSNYHTDSFRKIITRASKLLKANYQDDKQTDSLNVIADHVRAIVFLINDGVVPGADGRNYVLRRILRRAMRHGRKLGANKPFLYQLANEVIDGMAKAYPALNSNQKLIQETIKEEEEQFLLTLERGIGVLHKKLAEVEKTESHCFPGDTAFHLYETYGFPVDLTRDILREHKLNLDENGFEKAFAEHREKAKGSWKAGDVGDEVWQTIQQDIAQLKVPQNHFVGYEKPQTQSELLKIYDQKGKSVKEIQDHKNYFLLFSSTPFYAESGGQVGDTGRIHNDNAHFEVKNVKKLQGLHIHQVELSRGDFSVGDFFDLKIDESIRHLIRRNHTLTHILHATLREVLGDHVRQAGSYLDANRLTFDFAHHAAISPVQLKAIEMSINKRIWQNNHVTTELMPYKQAIKNGATAFFEEKYADEVRVVSIGDYSMELCGGTHAPSTSEIGVCHIVGETSVAAKTRRIEVISGLLAMNNLHDCANVLKQAASELNTSENEVLTRTQELLQENKRLKKQVVQLEQLGQSSVLEKVVNAAEGMSHGKLASHIFEQTSVANLRTYADRIMEHIQPGVVALGTINDEKPLLLVKVSKQLTNKVSAAELIKQAAPIIGGRGGGKADMAQAGGSDGKNLKEAIESIRTQVAGLL